MGEELLPSSAASDGEEALDNKSYLSDSGELGSLRCTVENIGENCLIPSPILKGEASSFFGTDLSSALKLLGTKYNSMVKKYQEDSSKLELLETECDALRSKCINECESRYSSLKEKYTSEYSERKRLYNELIELKGNIRVFCRCRPLRPEEISEGNLSVLDNDAFQEMELQIICADASRKRFNFDHVFSPLANQEDVFRETLPVVRSVLDGYNVCIFAYGQTGSGKTFTMEGTSGNRGVNYKALEELFKSSQERSSFAVYKFCISMLEVYNERIRDLLADNSDQPTKRLEIKQGSDGNQEVPGLEETEVYCVDEVWEMLKAGGRNRSVASTNANEQSSRSHCLVRATVKSENLVSGKRSKSHMWLVDLAGSERVGKIEAEGERLKESQYINKSLSALGDVISSLASKNPHIPYRNSKLTHLLQSSLGGDCKTLMFAQISPSSADLGETICTLNFASRVRGVQQGPARKQADPEESFKIKQMTEKLRQEEKEVSRLNESLHLINLKYAARENVFKTLQEKLREAEGTCRRYQQKVRDLENQIAENKGSRPQQPHSGEYAPRPHKPPLAPVKQRPPLAGITNHMPPPPLLSGRPRRISLTSETLFGSSAAKENLAFASNTSTAKLQAMRAQRISLTPRVMPVIIPVQRKRRASIAVLPSTSNSQPSLQLQQKQGGGGGGGGDSFLRARRSRNSLVRFPSWSNNSGYLPPPLAPSAIASTPDSKLFTSRTSSKYSSPVQESSVPGWMMKSRIPSIGEASPRERNCRVFMSPTAGGGSRRRSGSRTVSNSHLVGGKLCFSVQRKVIVSPAQNRRRHRLNGAVEEDGGQTADPLKEKEIVGVGIAQRVLVKKRRMSVM